MAIRFYRRPWGFARTEQEKKIRIKMGMKSHLGGWRVLPVSDPLSSLNLKQYVHYGLFYIMCIFVTFIGKMRER